MTYEPKNFKQARRADGEGAEDFLCAIVDMAAASLGLLPRGLRMLQQFILEEEGEGFRIRIREIIHAPGADEPEVTEHDKGVWPLNAEAARALAEQFCEELRDIQVRKYDALEQGAADRGELVPAETEGGETIH